MGVTKPPYCWWFNKNSTPKGGGSPWLQSTLAELDEKTEAMLKIIEGDADTFAQRAEMYFKKRPQLIEMVGEIYRTHQLLAEGYDQIKNESRPHILASWKSSYPFDEYSDDKSVTSMEKTYDSYSESFDPEPESEVSDQSDIEDPINDVEVIQIHAEKAKADVSTTTGQSHKTDEVLNLSVEIARLKEENRVQQEIIMQKDEEKREAIRQLSLAVDFLKEENSRLRMKSVRKVDKFTEVKASKKGFWKRLFTGSPESEAAFTT